MKWPKLIAGTIISRHKRFLFEVRLRNHHTVTAHCPNTGSMTGCYEPGCTAYLSRSSNPARRLPYAIEMTRMGTALVGVNTMIPNRLVREAIAAGRIEKLSGYPTLRSEVGYGTRSRIDLLLESGEEKCFVEIKNCTLVADQVAYFPDAVSSRGRKHLLELTAQVNAGDRCVMFYLIQRMDARLFKPADHIDPAYGKALRTALRSGVEIMVYDVTLNLKTIELHNPIPLAL